jgi:acetylglutamate/LysW-gamma-L-alpha-aminoadipate kinase
VIKVVENGRTRLIRHNYTGKVTQVNRPFLQNLLNAGCLPVLTPPAISFEGEAINVDGDRAAAATAAAFRAEELLILSNVPGVLRHFPDEASLIPQLSADQIDQVAAAHAQGRMRIKLLGAQEALAQGVRRVVLGDARGQQPILRALDGQGTVITQPQPEAAS